MTFERNCGSLQFFLNLLAQEILDKNGRTFVPHLIYSPDLASCDAFILPKPKLALKGRRFDDIVTIQK
jgi:hypothetical protein